jgi:hypothetical protein
VRLVGRAGTQRQDVVGTGDGTEWHWRQHWRGDLLGTVVSGLALGWASELVWG